MWFARSWDFHPEVINFNSCHKLSSAATDVKMLTLDNLCPVMLLLNGAFPLLEFYGLLFLPLRLHHVNDAFPSLRCLVPQTSLMS